MARSKAEKLALIALGQNNNNTSVKYLTAQEYRNTLESSIGVKIEEVVYLVEGSLGSQDGGSKPVDPDLGFTWIEHTTDASTGLAVEITWQYLGGTLGDNNDGWVRGDSAANTVGQEVAGWAAGASSLITDNEGNVTGWQYADGSGVPSEFKISADDITMEGTVTFLSSGDNITDLSNNAGYTDDTVANSKITSGGAATDINNNTTTIDGGKITANTLELSGDAIVAGTISSSRITNSGLTGTPNNLGNTYILGGLTVGSDVVILGGGGAKALSVSQSDSSNQALYVQNTGGAGSVGIEGAGDYAVVGNNGGSYGFWTAGACWFENAAYPFTGAHICYGPGEFAIGDIVEVTDSWVVSIMQTLVHTRVVDSAKSRCVFGVVNNLTSPVMQNIERSPTYSVEITETQTITDPDTGEVSQEEVGTGVWHVKLEYEPYVQYMLDNNFNEVRVNALGEGGMNVCEANGDILNGDYITSSDVKGKGMCQLNIDGTKDDVMRNYTVAKVLEDVIWDSEIVNEGGCYLFEGIKCKQIAVTYHCG